jgi:hypothetical protein
MLKGFVQVEVVKAGAEVLVDSIFNFQLVARVRGMPLPFVPLGLQSRRATSIWGSVLTCLDQHHSIIEVPRTVRAP